MKTADHGVRSTGTPYSASARPSRSRRRRRGSTRAGSGSRPARSRSAPLHRRAASVGTALARRARSPCTTAATAGDCLPGIGAAWPGRDRAGQVCSGVGQQPPAVRLAGWPCGIPLSARPGTVAGPDPAPWPRGGCWRGRFARPEQHAQAPRSRRLGAGEPRRSAGRDRCTARRRCAPRPGSTCRRIAISARPASGVRGQDQPTARRPHSGGGAEPPQCLIDQLVIAPGRSRAGKLYPRPAAAAVEVCRAAGPATSDAHAAAPVDGWPGRRGPGR